MKNLVLVVALFVTSLISAQEAINYQAQYTDQNGTAVTNTLINVTVDIITDSPNGSTVYSEIHTVTTSDVGIFSLEIGNGTAQVNLYNSIDFSDILFLKLSIDGNFIGTSQILNVPKANYATTAGKINIKELDESNYTLSTSVNNSGNFVATLQFTTQFIESIVSNMFVKLYDNAGSFSKSYEQEIVDSESMVAPELGSPHTIINTENGSKIVLYLKTIDGGYSLTIDN